MGMRSSMVLKANPPSTSMPDAEVPASERVTQTLLSSTIGLAARPAVPGLWAGRGSLVTRFR